jgi:hypothetical protein
MLRFAPGFFLAAAQESIEKRSRSYRVRFAARWPIEFGQFLFVEAPPTLNRVEILLAVRRFWGQRFERCAVSTRNKSSHIRSFLVSIFLSWRWQMSLDARGVTARRDRRRTWSVDGIGSEDASRSALIEPDLERHHGVGQRDGNGR